jgi:serine/threonine protein kinase
MHHSGLDNSNGTAFLQQRLALFAKCIFLISAAFFLVNVIIGLWFRIPLHGLVIDTVPIAHLGGLALLGTTWLVTSRMTLSLPTINLLDIIALIGSCTAWALFIDDRYTESVFGAVVSVAMTTLAHAIIIPSKWGRTLRLSTLAVLPVLSIMWIWLGGRWWARTTVFDVYAPGLTAVNQTLLLIVVVVMATVTSRILYDLRRTIREANELGQYLLEEKLGAGGMGEVWRARHRLLVRDAAIKLIRPELLAGSETGPDVVLRRFEREALATAALRSPHTVHLYDFGQAEDGTLFYVMELLQGIDLEKLVGRFGPVPPERAIHILNQVCHSLAEAHQNGLTHRDIKPANIFVSGTGTDCDFVKVLDFGLVRLRPETTSANVYQTNEQTVGGTPAYVAPEIVLGDAPYDHRVDIYAVGCVAYWLLTGHLVFNSGSAMAMLADHARSQPPLLSTRTELPIPPDLEQLIMQCLEKEPGRRPSSAAELAARLTACKVEAAWTRERAERWWQQHLPMAVDERAVADVLLSHEGSPVKALRPRRPASAREPV